MPQAPPSDASSPLGVAKRLVASAHVRVFAAFFLVYVFTSSGGFEVSDALFRYGTAKSWFEGHHGELTIDGGPAVRAADGRVFSCYGPVQSLLMLPFVAFAEKVTHGSPDALTKLIFATFVIPALSALSMTLVLHALEVLGYERRTALVTTLFLGLATPLWHYSRSGQEENIVVLGLAIYLCGVAEILQRRYRGVLVAAAGLCFAVATRWLYAPVAVILAIPVLVALWRNRSDARSFRLPAIGSLVVCLTTLSALLVWNVYRFGSPLETGYGIYHRHLGKSFFIWSAEGVNLLALLVSPYRGMLLFFPAVLLLLGLVRAPRTAAVRFLGPAVVATWLFMLLFIASFRFWAAGNAWGPRYLVAPIVLLAPMFAAVFAKRPLWRGWPALIAVSVLVQLCSVVVPTSAEDYAYALGNREAPGRCTPWTCECTALCLRGPRAARSLTNTLTNASLPVIDGSEPSDKGDLADVLASSDYNSVYWWPVRAAYRTHKVPPAVAFVFCLAMLGAALTLLRGVYRRSLAEASQFPSDRGALR